MATHFIRRLNWSHLVRHNTRKQQQQWSRNLLSDAYSCKERWAQRLQEPLLQKIRMSNYYFDLDKKFQSNRLVTAVDVDLFLTNVSTEEFLDEMDDLLHKFRKSSNTVTMLPSTGHAAIRHLLQFGQHDTLMRILDDRYNYGVYPEDYEANLMMDTFLKEQNYRDAAKVAILLMLQEDFGHTLTKHMALYSCHMYLKTRQPEPWDVNATPPQPVDDDEEETLVRVAFIRNPFFDDHFDLRDPQHLIGKTLAYLGRECNDILGRTYELIGWGMYEKWDQANDLLDRIAEKNETVLEEGVQLFVESLKSKSGDESLQATIQKLQGKLEGIEKKGNVVKEDLLGQLESKLKAVIAESEKQLIDSQTKLYSKWAQLRMQKVQEQIEEYYRMERIKTIQEKEEELKKREQLIYFFDNFEKHAMNVERYEQAAAIVEKQKQAIKLQNTDDEYIPPKVR